MTAQQRRKYNLAFNYSNDTENQERAVSLMKASAYRGDSNHNLARIVLMDALLCFQGIPTETRGN